MGNTKNLLIEDWERLPETEKMFLEEEYERLKNEDEWRKLLSLQEGKIVVEEDSPLNKEHETNIPNKFL